MGSPSISSRAGIARAGRTYPHALRVIAIGHAGALARGNALSRLAVGGLVAVPSGARAADAVWADVPPWAKAILYDRGARLVGWSPGGRRRVALAAAFAGMALAAAAGERGLTAGRAIDAAVVAREVAEALRLAGGEAAALGERGARVAREAFEAHVEVPRSTIDREDDGVQARAARLTRCGNGAVKSAAF